MSTRGESRNVSGQTRWSRNQCFPPWWSSTCQASPLFADHPHLVAPNSTTSADMLRPLLSPITLSASYPKFATNGKVQTHLTVSNIRAKPPLQTDPRIGPETENSRGPEKPSLWAFPRPYLGSILSWIRPLGALGWRNRESGRIFSFFVLVQRGEGPFRPLPDPSPMGPRNRQIIFAFLTSYLRAFRQIEPKKPYQPAYIGKFPLLRPEFRPNGGNSAPNSP